MKNAATESKWDSVQKNLKLIDRIAYIGVVMILAFAAFEKLPLSENKGLLWVCLISSIVAQLGSSYINHKLKSEAR